MPAIIIESIELTDEQKEIIAEQFISIFSDLTRVPKDRIYLFFEGYSLDNVATAGKQFSKMPPRNIISKYTHYTPPEGEK